MTSVVSGTSGRSFASKEILDNVSKKSETRLLKMEANVNDTMITAAWNAFGLYLTKNIRLGKATTIPKFGIITFNAPYVNLNGVTNPEQRDLRQRVPVFIISKEFVKGMNIQSGIVSGGNARPFSMKGVISGLGQAKINYTEVGLTSGLEKDIAKTCVERVIKELAEKAKSGKPVEMEIPNLGTFMLRNQIAAIEFDEFLVCDALDATNKFVQEKKAKGETSALTTNNLKEFIFQLQRGNNVEDLYKVKVDPSAQDWLKTNLNIDIQDLKKITRPQTAKLLTQKFNGSQNMSKGNDSETESIYSRPASSNNSVRSNMSRNMRNTQISEEKAQFIAFENAKRKIRMWIKTKGLLPEDAFREISKNFSTTNVTVPTQLHYLEFKKALSKISVLNLEANEIEAIAKMLDLNKQNFINIENWIKMFSDGRSYIDYIKDVIAKYNLRSEDILRRMGLHKNPSAQNLTSLREKLRLLDPSLSDSSSLKLAKEILKDKEQIEVTELLKTLGQSSDNISNNNGNGWYKMQLMRIKKKARDALKLREHFEKFDEKNQGLLDIPSFKKAIINFNIEFSQDDLNTFTRHVEKDTNLMIDYVKFTEMLDKLKTEDELQILSISPSFIELEQFNIINDKFQEYYALNKVNSKDLIQKISITQVGDTKKVFLDNFAEFFYQLFKSSFIKKKSCYEFAKRVDIDKDGFINETDLETFMIRNNYIKEGEKEMKASKAENEISDTKLFPKTSLSEERVETILRDLRQALNWKRISFFEFFRMLDAKQTGFVTINDFSTGIDKVMKLSQPIKDGFFAYIDTEKLGIINYEDLLKVLQRSVVDKRVQVTEDNFDWQASMLKRIRDYALEKNLKPEDAFRIVDADFDGFISKEDLLRFLKEVLNIPGDEATKPRIDRLFKLLDFYKRGSIQLSDIKMLLQHPANKTNLILTGGNEAETKSSFDWRIHARQQIGLVISKQFSDLESSFKEISEKNPTMKYMQFNKWVEKNRVLSGFDLTKRLVQKLFADLDPHKKGYLTEADWMNAFAGYNTRSQILSEVQEALITNYSDIQSAYDFFISHETQLNQMNVDITYPGFERAINALLPKRFGESEIKFIWQKFAGDSRTLSFRQFIDIFGNKKFSGTSYTALAKSIQASKFLNKPQPITLYTNKVINNNAQTISKEEKQKKIFEKLRQILMAANVSVESFFSQIDTDKTGDLSNLEFMNAVKALNLGLNLQEIEDLIMYCDANQDGKVSFYEFIRRFAPQVVENRLFGRSKWRLKKFKDNIYLYMLSPKDAFLKFNEDRTGKLTFEQFNKMIIKLYQLAKEEVPSFTIIKDMFDFLDIRKDGVIDMTEWMQSFRLIENDAIGPNIQTQLPQRRAATVDVRSLTKTYFSNGQALGSANKITSKNDLPKSPTALAVSTWECSKEYEKILKLIGKNRKNLINTFDDLKQKGVIIDASQVKEVIGELLLISGLRLTESQWLYMYKFAEKDGVIDYKFMLEIFKERLYLLSAHPKTDVMNL